MAVEAKPCYKLLRITGGQPHRETSHRQPSLHSSCHLECHCSNSSAVLSSALSSALLSASLALHVKYRLFG